MGMYQKSGALPLFRPENRREGADLSAGNHIIAQNLPKNMNNRKNSAYFPVCTGSNCFPGRFFPGATEPPFIFRMGWRPPGVLRGAAAFGGRRPPNQSRGRGQRPPPLWLSKKWLAPLFRGVHSSLAPTARPGSYARKPLLRKAFCGFDAHVAKSDQSLRGLRPPNPRGFSTAWGAGPKAPAPALCALCAPAAPPIRCGFSVPSDDAPVLPSRFSPTKPARRSR